jgi:adenylate cyclase
LLYMPNHAIAVGNFLLGRYEKAAEAARLAVQSKPEFSVSHIVLAAALAGGGDLERARAAASRALVLDPKFSTRAFCNAVEIPITLAKPFSEALHAAGLPD